MGKVLLAFVFVVGLSVTGLAANIHFALPASTDPVTNLDVDQAGGLVTLELHFNGEGTPIGGGNAQMANSSPALLPLAHVGFFPNWAMMSGFQAPAFYTTFSTGVNVPGDDPIATFMVTVPGGLPISTLLTLTANHPGSFLQDSVGNILPTTFTDLVIHITPEPATLGLLVLGGLAVLRRRFA